MWKNMTVAVFFESIPINASISSSTDFSTCPLNNSEAKLNFPFGNCSGKPIPFYLVFTVFSVKEPVHKFIGNSLSTN